jgi:MFS family permease
VVAEAVVWRGAYWRLWSASTAANVGDGIRAAAFPLIAATFSRDPLVVGGLTAAAYLPWLLFGLLGGAVVDRVDRRRLSWTVNAVRALALCALVLGLATGVANVAWLYAAAFVVGIGETLADNAVLTMLPTLVPSEHLDTANGRLVSAQVAGNEFIGPLLGSLLFSYALLLPVAVDAATLGVAAVLLLSLPLASGRAPSTARETGVRNSIREGIRFVRSQPRLRAVVAIGTGVSMADAAWFSILVLYAVETLRLEAGTFGVLLAVGAIGGVLGGVVAGRITRRLGRAPAAAAALAATALAQLVIGVSATVVPVAVMLAVSSAAFAIWNTISVTERHIVTPNALLGRVNATYRTAVVGVAPVGAVLGGLLARQLGLRAPLLAGVVPLLLLAVLAWRRLGEGSAADPHGGGQSG